MGDAAFGMTGLDFETAVRCGVPICTIVLNNSTMAIEIPHMKLSHERHNSRDLGGSYANLARDLGGWSERVEDPAQVGEAILRARRQTEDGRACLLEFVTSAETAFSRRRHEATTTIRSRRSCSNARRSGGCGRSMRIPRTWSAPPPPARLEKLAREVRGLRGTPLFLEYLAICNWLGELDGISDFMELANDYRARIGVDRSPADGEAYLRALIELAKQTFGTA